MGAFNAVSDDLIQIAIKMQDVSRTMTIINSFADDVKNLNEEVKSNKQDVEAQRSGNLNYYKKYSEDTDFAGVFLIVIGTIMFLCGIMFFSGFDFSLLFFWGINVGLIFCGIMMLIIGKKVARKKGDTDITRINNDILEKEKSIKEKEEKIKLLLTNDFYETLKIIPPKYRYPFAIDKLAEYIENGRAESMKEAVNLFEEEKHRWQIEELERQQAERVAAIQGYARRTATASTISAGADAINLISRLF